MNGLGIYDIFLYQNNLTISFFNIQNNSGGGIFLGVTSFGNMPAHESSLISVSYDGKALIFVKGAGRVTMDDSVRIQSPFGSKLNLHNFTHWESFNVRKVFTHALRPFP